MTPENIERSVNFAPRKHKKASIALRVAAALGTVAAASGLLGCEDDPMDENILSALSGVCQGQGVGIVADYNEDLQISPLVILDSGGGKHPWTNKVPNEWRPLTVEGTELVVCMGKDKEEVIEDCDYYIGPNVIRYQHSMDIELREAKTGNLVESVELTGSTPGHCREWEEIPKTRIDGSGVSFGKARDWLEGFVE